MGLASRWWTTGPASNAGFGFRRPRCRDPSLGEASLGEASLGPRCPVLSRRSPGQSQNESHRDADGAGLAIVSLPQAVVLALQPMILPRHVLALDVSDFTEPFAEGGVSVC